MSETLSAFFDRLAAVNPFLENRVNGPVLASWDVAELHRGAFERLTALAGEALRVRRGLGVVLWGTLTGAMLPFLLKRLKLDPATSSAPFVATLVDVVGVLLYFSAAVLILAGTLL